MTSAKAPLKARSSLDEHLPAASVGLEHAGKDTMATLDGSIHADLNDHVRGSTRGTMVGPSFYRINRHYLVVDLIISSPEDHARDGVGRWDSIRMDNLCWKKTVAPGHYKLLLPAESGYFTSSSWVEQRLNGVSHVKWVKASPKTAAGLIYIADQVPDQLHAANGAPSKDSQAQAEDQSWVTTLLRHKVGSLLSIDVPHGRTWEQINDALNAELEARLNVPWTLPGPEPLQRRVALVRGRMTEEIGRPLYDAVASLGIKLVVIDQTGHWAEADTEHNRVLRESFINADMTEDDLLVDRLCRCIRAHPDPIHGIFTCSDNYFVAVAKVAETLGFATSPSQSYKITGDKYLSRKVLQDVPTQVAHVASYKDLQRLISTGEYVPTYPLIVKPTKGWSSECVARVDSPSDLQEAVERACGRHADSAQCVVEPYFEGPEVDVNFVMLDGEVLFSEVADEPPREGDNPGAGVNASFSDVTTTSPSFLPQDEQDVIIETVRDMLLKIHMDTGVFHAEARLTGSRCHYGDVGGATDLIRPPGDGSTQTVRPVCHLLEINARPPGYTSTLSSLQAYGINYFQLHALAAIRDYKRLRVLSVPYDFSKHNLRVHERAQGWVKLMHISTPEGSGSGILQTRSGLGPIADLLAGHPELRDSVYLAKDEVKSGDKIDEYTAGGRTCIGHLGVMSKESRIDATRLGDRIKAMMKFDIRHPDERP